MKASVFDQSMNLIVIHKNGELCSNNGYSLLKFAICSEPLASIAFDSLNGDVKYNKKRLGTHRNSHPQNNNDVIAIPQDWAGQTTKAKSDTIYYKENLPIPLGTTSRPKAHPWFIVSNGRFVTQIDYQRLYRILAQLQADVIVVNVMSQLQAGHERVLIAAQSKLVGFRRFYNDLAQPAPIPDDWPHYLFVKTDILGKLLVDGALPLAFPEFINRCSSKSLMVHGLDIGGAVFDLETEGGLLGLLVTRLNSSADNHSNLNNNGHSKTAARKNITISPSARLFGNISLGQNVSIGQNVIMIGPTILGNNVKIAKGAVIRSSIIGPGVSVPRNRLIQSCVLTGSKRWRREAGRIKTSRIVAGTNGGIGSHENSCTSNFRTWSKISYARCIKRAIDIIAAAIVLILFAPVIPVIALAIKLSSPGPVFFTDRRQGLHGKPFNCLKFRTMIVGAGEIQDKLRVVNQADGPQFMMDDDPRLSTVGRFLRDTYIDEIPQFLNVLLGQMSVVGPRPSPEAENTLCPSWRDARLSVRPGITGLWQVCRTRQPMKDFQEWIHYDIKYVRELSLRTDLWICWRTVRKVTKTFISQF